jgi:hypothetical protein
MAQNGALILYTSEDGTVNVEVQLADGNVWLTQPQMADLFQKSVSTISEHIKHIYQDGELIEGETMRKFGNSEFGKPVRFYSLDLIISVGYRIKSHRGIQFRVWATKKLHEYMVKGFVIDDDRLSGNLPNYFDELVERVRKIRTSEANFYDKVRAIFATSIDYEPKSDAASMFYKVVQNKFHYAITGFTAAELIVNRANAYKPNMGVVHKKGFVVTKQETEVAKNYLQELELKRLELLVEQFLSFAELQSIEQRPMYMTDWLNKLDDFIRLNDKKVLANAGKVSSADAKAMAHEEYQKYINRLKSGVGVDGEEFDGEIEQVARMIAGGPADD